MKTTQQAAKAAQRTAQATARAARAAAHAARAAARAAVAAAKVAAKATIAAVKAIIAATKALIAAIAAGGWIAVLVIVIICLIGLLIGSCFGIFFSGEDSGSGYTMQNVVQEINDDYQQQIDTTKANLSHDVLEMSGSRAVWPEVLAVYAVKTTTDPDNPQEVATIDDSKKAILTDIFWEMNQISSRTETRTETVITETDDGNGNIVETETTVTQTYLYITVSHKTAEEMAEQYGFDEEQKEQLAELLAEENRSLWSAVLYGIYTEDGAIVSVALSQVGNVGGEPYWSWYGFSSRVEWCACFVSWCANECGYIDTGVIPKYAGCVNGVQWFKDRGQWMDGSAEPAPGMIIFFDWDDENGQDGLSDHTGIVEKVENGRVYTIEGNSGDSVRQNSYPVGYYEVLGYGCPDF
ncbi:chap domain protein [Flavonifractor sp. An91]|nr:chap domain protein [Flavonifractor sp. An91]